MKIPCTGDPPVFIDTDTPTSRTRAQVIAVTQIVCDPSNNFRAARSNPLRSNRVRPYSFVFAFYDCAGVLCTCWITPRGKIEYMDGPRAGWVDRVL